MNLNASFEWSVRAAYDAVTSKQLGWRAYCPASGASRPIRERREDALLEAVAINKAMEGK